MKEQLFKKIIHELREANYKEAVTLHSYGEPLTDPRILDWIQYTRDSLPEAKIPLFTNGELLSEDKIDLLLAAGVNTFNVTLHHRSQVPYPVLKKLEQLPAAQREIVSYTGTPIRYWLRNRGGLLHSEQIGSDFQFQKIAPCYGYYYPVIDYKGDFLLCCDDYLGRHPFGNLNHQTLTSILNDENYCRIRKKLTKREYELELCRRCNAGGFIDVASLSPHQCGNAETAATVGEASVASV